MGVGVTTGFATGFGVDLGAGVVAGFLAAGFVTTGFFGVGFFAVVVAVVAVVVDVVVVGVETEQAGGAAIVSLTRVTAPFSASRRPVTEAVEAMEIEVSAKMVPLNVPPASVAELPTCQNTQPA